MTRNRGKQKPKLRDIIREYPSLEERSAVTEALLGSGPLGPPIVTAILGAALLDLELEKLIRRRFKRRDDKTWTMMTELGAPLSGLNQKIIAGYALGHYDDVLRENLNIVRNIRNVFAHAKKIVSFDHPLIVAELNKISLPARTRSDMHRSLKAAKSLIKTPQACFSVLVFALSSELLKRGNKFTGANLRRRRKRWKTTGLLADVLAGYRPESPKGSGLSSVLRHIASPKIQPQSTILGGYLGLLGDQFRNKDK